jgi:hypothetical protein
VTGVLRFDRLTPERVAAIREDSTRFLYGLAHAV